MPSYTTPYMALAKAVDGDNSENYLAVLLATALDALGSHNHGTDSTGAPVGRLQTTTTPAVAGAVQVTGDALKWWGATSGTVRTAVTVEGTETITGTKTWSAAATFSAAGTALSVTNNASVGGALSVGASPATTGTIRIPVSGTLYALNAAGNANLRLLTSDSGNNLVLGDSTNAGVYADTGAAGSFNLRINGATKLSMDSSANVTYDPEAATTFLVKNTLGASPTLQFWGSGGFRANLSQAASGGVFAVNMVDNQTFAVQMAGSTKLSVDSSGNLVQTGGYYAIGSGVASTGTLRFGGTASAYVHDTADVAIWSYSSATHVLTIGDATNLASLNLSAAFNVTVGKSGGEVGFYGTVGGTKQTVTGSRGGNAALASLLSALSTLGLVTDSSSA